MVQISILELPARTIIGGGQEYVLSRASVPLISNCEVVGLLPRALLPRRLCISAAY